MDSEQTVIQLKTACSRLKRDLTLNASKISTSIKREEQWSAIEHLLNHSDSLFQEFEKNHLELLDCFDQVSDSSLDSHKSVSGLSMSQYYDSVKSAYDATCDEVFKYRGSQNTAKVKECEQEILKSLDNINHFSGVLDKLPSERDFCFDKANVYFEEIDKAIALVTQLLSKVKLLVGTTNQGNSEMCVQAEICIVTIQRKVVEIKAMTQVRSAISNSDTHPYNSVGQVGADNSQIHVARNSPHPLSSDHFTSVSQQGTHLNTDTAGQARVQVSDQSAGHYVTGSQSHAQPVSNVSTSSVIHAYNGVRTMNPRSPIHTRAPDTDRREVYNTGESQFKRSNPPCFDGERSKWAEFRSVWQLYGARSFSDPQDRAWALKQCLKGEAYAHVKAIYSNQPNAYDRMWDRLDSIYSDVSMSVQQAHADMNELRSVKEGDTRSLIHLINTVENCYSQLGEVNQIPSITMSHIDNLCDKLPLSVRKDWMRRYQSLPESEKITPFTPFMVFLEQERVIAIRLSGRQQSKPPLAQTPAPQGKTKYGKTNIGNATDKPKTDTCLVHTTAKHSTEKCNAFLKMDVAQRRSVVRKGRACFLCFGGHMRNKCNSDNSCQNCHQSHHTLLCSTKEERQSDTSPHSQQRQLPPDQTGSTPNAVTKHSKGGKSSSEHNDGSSLFAIQTAKVAGKNKLVSLFFDGGSNTTYITHKAARRLGAKLLKDEGSGSLNIMSLG